MAISNHVELVVCENKIEFRYKVMGDTLLATAVAITTEVKGESFDGYIIIPARVDRKEKVYMFGITIHQPDIIYRVRTVNIAITRLLGIHVRGTDAYGVSKFVKGIKIHQKIGSGFAPRKVYRDGTVAIYPSAWADRLEPRVGRELLPWYLENRTRYFR